MTIDRLLCPEGWDPQIAALWPGVVEMLVRSGLEWTDDAILSDLRWWARREERGDGHRPGRPALAKRWRTSDDRARRFLRREPEWQAPAVLERHQDVGRAIAEAAKLIEHSFRFVTPPAAHQLDTSRTPAQHQPPRDRTPTIGRFPPAAHQPDTSAAPADLHTRVCSEDREQRTQDRGGEREHAPAPPPSPVSIPPWVSSWPRPSTVSDEDLLDLAVRCVRAVRRTDVVPAYAKIDASPALELWAQLGHPDVAAFVDDFEAVAAAAHDCPAPLFANDLRAEGWAKGTPRQRSVKHVANADVWSLRLDEARAWQAEREAARPPRTAPSATGDASGPPDAPEAHPDLVGPWSEALEALAEEVDREEVNVWLGRAVPVRLEGSRLTAWVANPYYADWIREHYAATFAELLAGTLGRPIELVLEARPVDG